MINPRLEMQRLAGEVALLVAGIYLLLLFGAAVGTVGGNGPPVIGWPMLLLPAVAFVPSALAAVQLHRTSDVQRIRVLWRRSLLLAAVGVALLVAAAAILERMS